MSKVKAPIGARTPGAPGMDELLAHYGCGPVQFTGTADALYDRHLMFDNVVAPAAAGPRECYEAVAGIRRTREPIRSGRGGAGLGRGGAGTLPRVREGEVREDLPDDRWIVQRGDQPEGG